MSQAHPAPAESLPALLTRVHFDIGLEALAFRKLSELDLVGARAAFGALADRLELSGIDGHGREVVLLLLDVLLRVNGRLHRIPNGGGPYQEIRAALIRQFATIEQAEQARRAFLPALHTLLVVLEAGPGSAGILAERARALIEEGYSERLSLSSIARSLHVSPNYLSRMFKRTIGTTLTAYIHKVRVRHACLLLQAGGRTISEIAYLVGYQNYRDFYRNFVKCEHVSPRKAQHELVRGEAKESR